MRCEQRGNGSRASGRNAARAVELRNGGLVTDADHAAASRDPVPGRAGRGSTQVQRIAGGLFIYLLRDAAAATACSASAATTTSTTTTSINNAVLQ